MEAHSSTAAAGIYREERTPTERQPDDAERMLWMNHGGAQWRQRCASGPIWGSAFRAAARSAKGKDTLSVDDFAQLMQAAVSGIQATGERSFGRAGTVGERSIGYADAGAYGLAVIFDDITKSLNFI